MLLSFFLFKLFCVVCVCVSATLLQQLVSEQAGASLAPSPAPAASQTQIQTPFGEHLQVDIYFGQEQSSCFSQNFDLGSFRPLFLQFRYDCATYFVLLCRKYDCDRFCRTGLLQSFCTVLQCTGFLHADFPTFRVSIFFIFSDHENG